MIELMVDGLNDDSTIHSCLCHALSKVLALLLHQPSGKLERQQNYKIIFDSLKKPQDKSKYTVTRSRLVNDNELTFSKRSALPGRVGSCPGK